MTEGRAPKIILLLLVVSIVASLIWLPVQELLNALVSFESHSPIIAALAYVALTTLLVVLLTPGWVLLMIAGLMFGLVEGVALASIATTAGSLAAFIVGRTAARGWVRKQIHGNPRLEALDDAIGEQSFRIVLLTRIALILPFNLLNYVYGATRVSASTFTIATAIGMLPAVGIYVYVGSLSEDIGQILSRERSLDASTWVVIAVAVAAIILAVRLVQKAASAALSRRLENKEE